MPDKPAAPKDGTEELLDETPLLEVESFPQGAAHEELRQLIRTGAAAAATHYATLQRDVNTMMLSVAELLLRTDPQASAAAPMEQDQPAELRTLLAAASPERLREILLALVSPVQRLLLMASQALAHAIGDRPSPCRA